MLTKYALYKEISSEAVLGKKLLKLVAIERPPERYERIEGEGQWDSDLAPTTNKFYTSIVNSLFWKPRTAKKKDSPTASRLMAWIHLKGKTAYRDVAEFDLTAREAFHLNVGHELTHALARKGKVGGKVLYFLEWVLPASIILFIIGFYKADFDVTKILCSSASASCFIMGVVAAVVYYYFLPNTNQQSRHERRGTVFSYDREEVVAEIGACLLLDRAGEAEKWPKYSIALIASRLSTTQPEYRCRVFESAWADAEKRVASMMMSKIDV